MLAIKKINLLFLSCLLVHSIVAQLNKQEADSAFYQTPAIVEDELFKIDFLTPGFQYEKALSDNSTLQIGVYQAFAGSFFDWDNLRYLNNWFSIAYLDIEFLPKIELAYRYYYNLSKRKSRCKNFTNNSAQYVSPKLMATYSSQAWDNNNTASLGCVWGIQKNGEPITFNFEIGIGCGIRNIDYNKPSNTNLDNANLAILGKLTTGILVGKRNQAYKKYKQQTLK